MEPTIKDLFDTIYLHKKDMTARQMEFIDSVKNKILSEKELSVLNEIKKYHSKTEQRYSMKINN